MPAEWEPHEATWMAWPHDATTGRAIRSHSVGLRRDRPPARAVERVHILIEDGTLSRRPGAYCEKRARIWMPSSSSTSPPIEVWTRDFCPMFVKDARRSSDHQLALQRLGEIRQLAQLDDAIPRHAGAAR